MNCWRVQSLLAPFLDGELPGTELEAVAEHLEACDGCAEAAASVADLPPLLPFELPQDSAEGLFAAFDRCLAERIALSDGVMDTELASSSALSWYRNSFQLPAGLAAAYVLLVVGLGVMVSANHQRVNALEDGLVQRDQVIETLQRRASMTALERDAQLPPPDWSALPAALEPPPREPPKRPLNFFVRFLIT